MQYPQQDIRPPPMGPPMSGTQPWDGPVFQGPPPVMGGSPPMMGGAMDMGQPPPMMGGPMDMGPPMGGPPPMGQPMTGPPMGMGPMDGPSMGMGMGPPPMGMGPPMGGPMEMAPMGGVMMDPQSQAEAALAELEEKQRQKDAKDKKKETEQLTKLMRTGQRAQDDAVSTSYLICLWGILNAVCWAVPLFGNSWYTKGWEGFGVDRLTIETGLFNLNVKVKCKSNYVSEEKLCHVYQKYMKHEDGHWGVKELEDKMCSDIKEACPIMERMYFSAFGPLVGFPLAASLELLSVLLLYFYWHGKPSSLVRKMAHNCAALSPCVGGLGFIGWLAISPYIMNLPRLWAKAEQLESFANDYSFGLKETFMVPFGWCSAIVVLVFCSSGIKMFMQKSLGKHIDEPVAHGLDETSHLMEQVQKEYDAMHPQRAA